jgi:hypothetical protein
MKKKYGALRFISGLYLVLGVMVFFVTLAGSVFVFIGSSGTSPNVGGAVSVAISGIFMAIGLLAFSEIISVIIDMEESARITAVSMQRLAKSLGSNSESHMRKRQLNEIDDPAF